MNKYKNVSVDTIGVDRLVRNPASYFSYYGFSRLYQFFSSPDYVRLEAKFTLQMSLDISRCFDSIYTHSIAWAVKSKELAKESTQALSFENQFDRVMQRLNHNETSGICIGPEASRIFAEVILAKADQNALSALSRYGIRDGLDFECRRYVDDYYVFANSEEVLSKFHIEIAKALREYNLHLNESKKAVIERPFYNQKTFVRDKVNSCIKNLSMLILDQRSFNGVKLKIPRRIHNRRFLFLNFTREVKAACYSSQLGYDAVANYVISAMKGIVVDLVDSYPIARTMNDIQVSALDYRRVLSFLLDVGSYYFAFHPTVASSLRLSVAVVRTAQHLAKFDPEGMEIVRETIFRWSAQLLRSPMFSRLTQEGSAVPVELLNVLICLREIGFDITTVSELVEAAVKENPKANYFTTIVQLYIYRNHDGLSDRKDEIFQSARERLLSARDLTRDAELTHLLLDLLACPFIELPKREMLIYDIWPILRRAYNNIGKITKRDARKIVREIEKQNWFVRWEGIDLLNMIEKKELGTVYA
ncbi:MAG: RNA-directed DNA polymerase [Gemmatimonadota bacterium]|nr:RNA-directed DNA polymerase [Gemmatimonadota bacterium]